MMDLCRMRNGEMLDRSHPPPFRTTKALFRFKRLSKIAIKGKEKDLRRCAEDVAEREGELCLQSPPRDGHQRKGRNRNRWVTDVSMRISLRH
jgi:hypothetical protein